MKDQVKIEASVASHRGNIHRKNEEKFYLNGQYMDLHQQKDSTSKSAAHNYKQSVYGIASGTLRGELGEQAAFITIEALSRYHLYLEENTPSSFSVKKQQLVKHLEEAKEKINELSRAEEEEGLGATVVGLILDKDHAFGFSVGEEGFYMIEEEEVRKVLMEDLKESHYIGSNQPMEKMLRITEEFALDEGDQLLLTSKDTYLPEMAARLQSLTKTLSPKESTKAFVKELLTREGRKNLTALLVHVESLGSFSREDPSPVFAAAEGLSDQQEPKQDSIQESNPELNPELKPEPERALEKELEKDLEKNLEKDLEKEPKEDPERERIFERRYAESQVLFNKKLQRRDLNFSRKGEEPAYEAGEPSEEYSDPGEEKAPWRNRSKFLLIAMLAVGAILITFVFGSIRDLEARIGNSSVDTPEESGTEGLEPEEASGDEPAAGVEEPGLEDPADEEADEQEATDEEATDEEAAEDDPDAGEESEPAPVSEEEAGETVLETYEVRSGDTLYSISRDIYSDESMVEEIIRLNNIEDINHIQVGDLIQLPPGE